MNFKNTALIKKLGKFEIIEVIFMIGVLVFSLFKIAYFFF